MKQLLAGLVGLLILSGCASQKGLDPQGAMVTSLTELPPPSLADGYANSPAYTVGPFDELTVAVFGVEELSGDVTADADGRVSVPLAGTIEAAGLTQNELAERIATNLRGYVRDPHVTVNVKEARSRTIAVDGQVKEPGVFRANGNLTLMRAVATAKGTTPDADVEDVVVFRTVNGQQMAALYNLGAIRRGTYNDPPIYPNDIVVVGDSPRTRLIREIAPVIATPIVLLLQTVLP
jgi:polysaccharide export outer membrane protein